MGLSKIQKSYEIWQTDNQRVTVMGDLYSGPVWGHESAACVNIKTQQKASGETLSIISC